MPISKGVSAALVLWLCYHMVALGMAVWAAASAFGRGAGIGVRHRTAALASGALLPPVLVAAAVAAPSGQAPLRFALAALPPLTLLAAWSGAIAFRERSALARLCHLPVLAWNCALCSVYLVRSLQDLAGVDCGTWGASLAGGHAVFQSWVGDPDALVLPVWLHLPLCLPIGRQVRWPHRAGLVVCAAMASAAIAALALAMPIAFDRAARLRAPVGDPPPLRAEQVLGVVVTSGDPGDRRALLDSLGASALVLDVDIDLLEDAARLAALRSTIDRAREDRRRIVVIARPTRALVRHPVADVAELSDVMAQVHWLCAERLAPDLLVLFAGPFGALEAVRADVGTIDAWIGACARGANEVRQANPSVRVAVALESRAPHAYRLFERLCASDSPVDAVGLIARPERIHAQDAVATFDVLASWIAETRIARPLWLLDVGACPTTTGGEYGQWAFVSRALELAARTATIQGICIRALEDDRSAMRGLVAPGGRRRTAFVELAARVGSPAAPR